MEQLKKKRPVRRVDISINMEATGANIRRLVKASGYTVRDIMAITGISTEQAVYKWFRGDSIPAIETMLILSSALGIEIRELLVIDGEFNFFEDMQNEKLSAKYGLLIVDMIELRYIYMKRVNLQGTFLRVPGGIYEEDKQQVGDFTAGGHNGPAALNSNVAAVEFKILCADLLSKQDGKCVYTPSDIYEDTETQIGAKAFRGKKIRTVYIGANVSKLAKKTFAKSRVTKIVLRTKKLTKRSRLKQALSGSRVRKVRIKVGSAKVNRKDVKKYRKVFKKKIVGAKVTVK